MTMMTSSYQTITTADEKRMQRHAISAAMTANRVARMIRVNSNTEKFEALPRFEVGDLQVGRQLGSGQFNDVYDVHVLTGRQDKFDLDDSSTCLADWSSSSRSTDIGSRPPSPSLVQNIHLIESGDDHEDKENEVTIRMNYAMKRLNYESLTMPERLEQGVVDLVREAYLLSQLNHPNIIKIRGVTSSYRNFSSANICDFFFLMDKLVGTLSDRIVKWKKRSQKKKNLFSWKKKNKSALFERLHVALQISEAMVHLHKKNIMFRDLKPDNIGFDSSGQVKLFDFGLARELKPYLRLEDDTYDLTGSTGSRRYMAPEVANNEPYNTSADVYSFGIMLWEIIELQKPFRELTFDEHFEKVVKGGLRPVIPSDCPIAVKELMRKCWSTDMHDRPTFFKIQEVLMTECGTANKLSCIFPSLM